MRVFLAVALLGLSSMPAAAAPADAPFDTPADWERMPDPHGLWVLMPQSAVKKGHGGGAVIECDVLPQGTLEDCKLISEKPAGEGFGQATLLAAPSFAMRPAMKDGRPVRSRVRIPVNFRDPPSAIDATTISVVSNPVWDAAPSFADMAAAWPKRAEVNTGHVSMRCRIAINGILKDCQVTSETPRSRGFAAAARGLAPKFRLHIRPGAADSYKKAVVNVPVHFNNPALNTPRGVAEPYWITALDPARAQAIFPSKAADAGVKAGKGYADCTVATDGHLVDCKPSGAAPDGLGFAEAAVQVASVMQMNPWTGGGGPVDGVRIRLPIAFNLAPEPPPAPAQAKP